MACSTLLLLIFVVLSSSSAISVHKSDERRTEVNSVRKQVVDFNIDFIEAGQEYIEKIKVDVGKQTELFQVPSHPGVDRSDVLRDFKHNLTMIRFPESKICYLFPLVKRQSTPRKLIRDLKKAKKMVITKTRRVDSTWIPDAEVTDWSALGEELADFCAQYSIYRVTEAREFMRVIGAQTEGRPKRVRRQSGSGQNGTKLCHGGMDLNKAQQICPEPRKKCKETGSCVKSVKCSQRQSSFEPSFSWWGRGPFGQRHSSPSCWNSHTYVAIVSCCEYVCDNVDNSVNGPAGNETSEVLERRVIVLG